MAARAAAAEARAALVTARTAAESVETLITERADAAEADADRREQHALDDMARTRFDSPGR
jgi:flagellar biosynthesis chaperone FliJ